MTEGTELAGTTDSALLYPKLTRAGLNELLSLPKGVSQAISEIGLGVGKYIPTAEMTESTAEVVRVSVIDSIITGENGVQYYAIADAWEGELTPIHEIIFYLESGTVLAIYSNPDDAEAVLLKGQPPELNYTLLLDEIPADKLNVLNTQRVFNPGLLTVLVSNTAGLLASALSHIKHVDELSAINKKIRTL